jgi:uncharacterized protein (DUF362 family)
MRPDDSLTVAIAHDADDIEKAVTRALGELALDDSKDKVVALKLNDTAATDKDKTACTQSDTLRAAVRFLKNLHPKQIIVTGGSGAKETEHVFRTMGFLKVVGDEGVEWFDNNRSRSRPSTSSSARTVG